LTIPGKDNNRTARYKYKKHSNAKISFYNQKIITELKDKIYPISLIREVDVPFSVFKGNKEDGDTLIYNHNVHEVTSGALIG
jgi:hypothetical protein